VRPSLPRSATRALVLADTPLFPARLVIESRDKVVGGEAAAWSTDDGAFGRTPNAKRKGKATRTSTLVGPRPERSNERRRPLISSCLYLLQSLIDLAGSEKATSDKLRSAEGKFINTSLLALKQVVSTIAKNELKKERYVCRHDARGVSC
jgi:hypothetical protein